MLATNAENLRKVSSPDLRYLYNYSGFFRFIWVRRPCAGSTGSRGAPDSRSSSSGPRGPIWLGFRFQPTATPSRWTPSPRSGKLLNFSEKKLLDMAARGIENTIQLGRDQYMLRFLSPPSAKRKATLT